MSYKRSISRALGIGALLIIVGAVLAPAAYGGEGILPDAPEVSADATSTVTDVTETAPTTEEVVEQVNTTTAPVTETVESVETTVQSGAPTVEPAEVVENVTSAPSVSVSTSTPDAPTSSAQAPSAPSSTDGSSPTTSGSGGTTTGTDAGGTSSTGSPATAESGPSTRPEQTFSNTSTSFMPPAERGSLRSAPGVFFAQAGDSPESILDDLLDIGNSIGVDQVRGLQITNARGENTNVAPESSGASTPAPLALTGMAIGVFLVIGLGLIAAGGGARAAGTTSTA